MAPKELLGEYEKRFFQLPIAERELLDDRKIEFFLQAADDDLQDKLFLLLANKGGGSGLTNDWRQVKEAIAIITEQRRIKARGGGIGESKIHLAPTIPAIPAPAKVLPDNTLEELVKGMRELKVKLSELEKKKEKVSSSAPSDGAKRWVKRCMYCDSEEHDRRNCSDYEEDLKKELIFFREGKVRLAATGEPVELNFGKGGMKKLVHEFIGNSYKISVIKEARASPVIVELGNVEANSTPSMEVMLRGAQVIRQKTGWSDPVDAASIKAFLDVREEEEEPQEAVVEMKRGRNAEEKGPEEPSNKRQSQRVAERSQRKEVPEKQTATPMESEPSTSSFRESDPLPKDKWEKRMEEGQAKEKDTSGKGKAKGPAFKLRSDIESSVDMKDILEERILDAKIEFTLREVLGIAKKDFHDLILDVIKRKRQLTTEAMMVKAFETLACESKTEEEKATIEVKVVGCGAEKPKGK